ncbi:hypothetical protein VTP21DRAFT_1898 [Calcarisporiella thermophila]
MSRILGSMANSSLTVSGSNPDENSF